MKMITKNIILFSIAVALLIDIRFALAWENWYGTFSDDFGRYAQRAYDGGYFISGNTRLTEGYWDLYMIKTDANGSVIWGNNYGNPNIPEIIQSAGIMPDQSFISVGETWNHIGAQEYPRGYMIKVDEEGLESWQFINDPTLSCFSSYAITNESPQQYVLTGWSMRTGGMHVYFGIFPDSRSGPGGPSTEKFYKLPNSFHNEGHCIQPFSYYGVNGYIIVGQVWYDAWGYPSGDLMLIRVNLSGDIIDYHNWGGTNDDIGYSIKPTSDNGFIIVGGTRSYGAGGEDVYLLKIDDELNIQWTKTFGGIEDDVGYDVQQTADGGYIICGSTESFGSGKADIYYIKVDADGNLLYETTYGNPDTYDYGYSIHQTPDNGYIIAGSTRFSGLSIMGDQVYCQFNENKPPSDLFYGPVVSAGVKLYWTDNSSKEERFEIDRKINNGAWSIIGTSPANNSSYVDNDIIPYYGQQITYRVRTITEGTTSDPSNEVSLVPPGIFTDINNAINNSHGSRQLYKDNSGKFHLTFLSDNKLWYTKSTNNGQTWQVADMISSNNPCAPSIGVTTTGLPCLIWEEVSGNNHDLIYAYLDGAGVYHYTTLVDNAQISLEPVMAINVNNQVAVAYVSNNTTNGIITYFTFAYSNPQYTSSQYTGCNQPYNPRITYDPSNNAHLVWAEHYNKQGGSPLRWGDVGKIIWAKFNAAKTAVDSGWLTSSTCQVKGPDIAAVNSTTLEFAYTVQLTYPTGLNYRWIYYRKKTGSSWTPRLNVTQDPRIGNFAYIPRVMRNQNTVLCCNTTKIFANYTNDPQNGSELVSGINNYYDGILASATFPQTAALVYTSGANPILINFTIKKLNGDPNKEEIQENESQLTGRFYFTDISPNPTKGEIRLRINSPDTRYMTVKLYDVLGREVNMMYNGNAHIGINEIVLKGSNLANGIYLVKLQTDEKTEIRKIVFQR